MLVDASLSEVHLSAITRHANIDATCLKSPQGARRPVAWLPAAAVGLGRKGAPDCAWQARRVDRGCESHVTVVLHEPNKPR